MKNRTIRIHDNSTEISVIIPAHNAEKTLRRAVESVCRALEPPAAEKSSSGQKHAGAIGHVESPEQVPAGRTVPDEDQERETAGINERAGDPGREAVLFNERVNTGAARYEVLIIENGSEDGTEFLGRTLELEHSGTVRFLRSEKGVSNARNRGLEKAKGAWVLFLDADDYLLEGAGAVLADDLHFTGTDLIIHSYEAGRSIVRVCGTEGERYSGKPARDGGGQAQTGTLEEILVRIIEDPTRYTAVWSKLYRRERIEYGRLRFDPSLRLSEDSHFLIRYLFLCRRIRLMDRPFYHYSTDNISVVRAWDEKKEEGYSDALLAVRDCLQTQPLPIRKAFAAYGMMQFNLLMVRGVFSLDSPYTFPQKISRMKKIKESGPFAEAFLGFDPGHHRGARYLPIRMLKSGFFAAAAVVYEARVLQNAKKERV